MRLKAILVLLMIPGAIALTTPHALSQEGYFEPTRLMTKLSPETPPISFQEVLGDAQQLTDVLRMMGGDRASALELPELLEEVRAGAEQMEETVSPGLSGLGGIFGHAILKAAEAKAPGGIYDSASDVTIEARGHVDGYFFDHQENGGYINVTTEIIVGSNGNIDVDRYRYEVEIGEGTFEVFPKDTTVSTDVFPGTDLEISAEMAAGFNYKLWAKGSQIRIVRLWIDNNNNGYFEPNERITTDVHGDWRDGYRKLLEVDDDACIDMMFVHYPPETLPPGAGPPFYCLGRCANPPLINTK